MRAPVLALLLLLAPVVGHPAAKVKSHSNTNNNRFAAQCAGVGGKVTAVGGASTCAVPKLDASSKESLRAACVADGGAPTDKGGAFTCDGRPASH